MKYKGDNIAIFDDSVSSKIKFEAAYQVVSTDFDFDATTFRTSIMHEIENYDFDGNIIWQKEVWRPKS